MIAALDIGGTKIAAGMVEEDGRLLASMVCPTVAEAGVDDAVRRMVGMLNQTAYEAGGSFSGVGIGCTGPVDPDSGVVGKVEFMPNWEGANLVQLISDATGVSAALENDADAAALGEWTWGAGKGTRTFLMITVGTGIGAGLILEGKLYRGVNSAHPEIGHHVIDPSGPLCSCGAHGCWESLASGLALERWMQERYSRAPSLSAREICKLADQGEPDALAAVQHVAHYLAIGLANLVTLFVPECITLGGGLMQSYALFEDEIQASIRSQCGYVPYGKIHIVPSALGTMGGMLGAACVWLSRCKAHRA